MIKEFFNFEGMHYLVAYPENFSKTEKYPLLFLIHGAGTRGDDPKRLENNVFYTATAKLENFPFVVIAPLCYANTWFDIYEKLKRFIIDKSNEPFVDKDKIYAMGASMGGYCVWQLGMSMPEHFAAIVPICGGGMYWNCRRYINLPVWAFHGELDGAVKVEESIKMVDAINSIGGNAKLTIYKDTYHDAWTATYKNQEVYDWLLSISNDNSKEIKDPYIDPIKF